MAMDANNTQRKPLCLDSTLSLELATFKLSPTLYGLLLSICIINGISSVLATLANSLVLFTIFNFSALRTQSNTLIVCLALTDVFVGLIVQPAFVIYVSGKMRLQFYCAALLTYLYTEIFCVGLSLITLSLVACERFFAIVYPFKYINYVTMRRLVKAVAMLWGLWFVFNVVCRALKVKNDEFFSPIASVIIGSCLVLNTVLYFRIFRVIRRHERHIHAQNQLQLEFQTSTDRYDKGVTDFTTQERNSSLNRAKETRMARTVAYITVIIVVCYSPLMMTSIADVLIQNDALFDHLLYPLAETTTFLNSAINPFIYCWRCRDLREKIFFYLGGTCKVSFGRRNGRKHGSRAKKKTSPRVSGLETK